MKTLCALGCAVMLAAGANAGLVAYWDFDEGSGQAAADASPNGYDFTLGDNGTVEASDPEWTTGRFGGALDFSGTTSTHATGSTSTDFNLNGSWSLSWWQMVYVTGAWQQTLAKNSDGRYTGDPDRGYLFITRFDTLEPITEYLASSASLGNGTGTTTGAWYHVVVTYDGVNNLMNSYVNGVHKLDDYWPNYNTTPWNAFPSNSNTSPLYLGRNMDGRMDDMAYFNEQLTEGKSRSVYTAGASSYGYDLGDMMQVWGAHDAQGSVDVDGTTWYYTDSLPGTFNIGDLYEDGDEDYIALTGSTGMTTIPEPSTLIMAVLGAGLFALRRKRNM
jgi:hypothetical protein